jgi:hypothetical protein
MRFKHMEQEHFIANIELDYPLSACRGIESRQEFIHALRSAIVGAVCKESCSLEINHLIHLESF